MEQLSFPHYMSQVRCTVNEEKMQPMGIFWAHKTRIPYTQMFFSGTNEEEIEGEARLT